MCVARSHRVCGASRGAPTVRGASRWAQVVPYLCVRVCVHGRSDRIRGEKFGTGEEDGGHPGILEALGSVPAEHHTVWLADLNKSFPFFHFPTFHFLLFD